jgi:hypothetical protein
MNQNSTPSFKVDCPVCNLTNEANTFHAASKFVEKHEEHTGHEMEWVRAEFDYDITPHEGWKLTCKTCSETWQFESEDAASEFRKEHTKYTDHEIANPPEKRTSNQLSGDLESDVSAVKNLIAGLEDQYEDGAPEQAIYAYFSGDSPQIAQVKHKLKKLKQQGEVYEPRTGYLRTT